MDGPGAMFDAGLRLLQRRMIAPAIQCDIDKTGRIHIPAQLRESVGLESKSESILLGIGTYLELWSIGDYEKFLQESEASFSEASQNLGTMLSGSGR